MEQFFHWLLSSPPMDKELLQLCGHGMKIQLFLSPVLLTPLLLFQVLRSFLAEGCNWMDPTNPSQESCFRGISKEECQHQNASLGKGGSFHVVGDFSERFWLFLILCIFSYPNPWIFSLQSMCHFSTVAPLQKTGTLLGITLECILDLFVLIGGDWNNLSVASLDG